MPALPPINSGPASSTYASQGDMYNLFGQNTIIAWSQVDGTADGQGNPTANVSRIQAALDYSSAEINAFFQDGPFVVPLTGPTVVMTKWSATIAAWWLYNARGFRDKDAEGSDIVRQRKQVYADMAMYKGGAKRLEAVRRWPTPSCPVCV